jgi:hypothetical protein
MAEANQHLIEATITELGGKPPSYVDEMKASDDLDVFIEKSKGKATDIAK